MRKLADLCGVSYSSVFRIAQESGLNKHSLKLASRRGHPRNPMERQKHLIIRSTVMLRTEQGIFSVGLIMKQAGINNSEVLVRTITRFLNEKSYYCLQAQKEGLPKRVDLKTKLTFAKWCKKDNLRIVGLIIYCPSWRELDLPTNQIPVSKLAQQRGHGQRYQRDLPWAVLPRDEKKELSA